MAPLQLFYLLSILLILPFAWMRGGHPERAGVVVLLLSYVSGPFLIAIQSGRLMVGIALGDVVMLVALIWLCARHDRWWLMLAAAAQTLAVTSHIGTAVNSAITARETMIAQWIYGLLVLYALLIGVLERRLAGEAPASPPLAPRSGPSSGPRPGPSGGRKRVIVDTAT